MEKMDTGLEKLAEASASVEILKQDLALMEKDLAEASQKVRQGGRGIRNRSWPQINLILFYIFTLDGINC